MECEEGSEKWYSGTSPRFLSQAPSYTHFGKHSGKHRRRNVSGEGVDVKRRRSQERGIYGFFPFSASLDGRTIKLFILMNFP